VSLGDTMFTDHPNADVLLTQLPTTNCQLPIVGGSELREQFSHTPCDTVCVMFIFY